MKVFPYLLALSLYSSAFAALDYRELADSKRDQPIVVTTTESISFPVQYGVLELPKGAEVNLLAVRANGTLDITYNGQPHSIPAAKTDLEKRVLEIRSHRIVIDGVEYEDIRWGSVTPTTVSLIHRTGAATIPLSKLPPDLQKRFGYDPQKIEIEQRKVAAMARLSNLRRINSLIIDFTPMFIARKQWKEYVEKETGKWYPTDPPERTQLYNAQSAYDPFQMVGYVVQVLHDGLLVDRVIGDSKYLTFVKHYTDQKSVVDGDLIDSIGVGIGRHTYTDVSGATRTISIFDCGEPVQESEATNKTESIALLLHSNGENVLR